ncbi:hypothetical protein NDU88_006968 [Pleurodeles waltl]|uniref:Uncharacterized protein n=1 Tax=Pleurodeles waltl TaxID=8319 RepID=A0AAV7TZ43_PLEWA|nr:hypothetical protein NDU88_006968 [Pleurodeles waltl]
MPDIFGEHSLELEHKVKDTKAQIVAMDFPILQANSGESSDSELDPSTQRHLNIGDEDGIRLLKTMSKEDPVTYDGINPCQKKVNSRRYKLA